MKDNFSEGSDRYARYRPTYPPQLYDFLFSIVKEKKLAWDCATGNGQVAQVLAQEFTDVYATDISEQQLAQAPKNERILYSIQPAEKTDFEAHSFNLITVAQAIHWFDFEKFYAEVNRTLRPDGILAVMGYALLKISPEIDRIVKHFYHNIIGKYWDEERKYIEDEYQSIPFPFKEISSPLFSINYLWNVDDLINYLSTWSAVKHYQKANGKDPLSLIEKEMKKAWGNQKKEVVFPVLLRLGKK